MIDQNTTPVEAAVPAAIVSGVQATRPPVGRTRPVASLPLQCKRFRPVAGFTLAELLVTVGVLALLVLLFTQLLNSTASITTLGHKQMDADSQARQLFDRMAIDFAQMVKRSDVDYYVKSNPIGASGLRTVLQPGNDIIAFYSGVAGYYPPSSYQSPLSIVAYRINQDPSAGNPAYFKLERMGRGLLWNAAPTPIMATPTPTATPSPAPVVFIPIPLASPLPLGDLPAPPPNPLPTPAVPEASSATTSWSASEVIGPQVLRFEYYYLLKNGICSDIPWTSPHSSVSGMQDVSAIVVDIVVIDPKSKAPLGATETQINAQIGTLAGRLIDYGGSAAAGCPTPNWQVPGELRRQWQCALDSTPRLPTPGGFPAPAMSGIRLYERYFYLSQ